jgi:transitional endoplasmic reticulum ATPase
MTGSVRLPVEVRGSGWQSVLPASVGNRVDLADGDAVRLRYGADRDVVTAVRLDDTDRECVVVSTETAQRLGVEGGETVVVAAATPAVAESVRLAPVPQLSVRGGAQLVRDAVGDRLLTAGRTVSVSLFDGSLDIPFRVLSTEPSGPVTVESRTDVRVEDGPAPVGGTESPSPVPSAAVGGYDEMVSTLETALAVALDDGATTSAGGGRAGILLAGPHGVGKTHLLRHAAWRTDASVHRVRPRRILSASGGDTTEYLRTVATAARGSERGVVHLDAFDTVVEETGEATVAAIREWLDDVASADGVTVVAEAVDPTDLPTDLTQGVRLSRTVTVPEPGRDDRAAVLATVASETPTAVDVDVSDVGRRAFGYVAADLVSLWVTAVELAAGRAAGDTPVVSERDLERALEQTDPSGLDDPTVDIPTTTFDDIGGLDEVKRELVRAVEWPLTNPELFSELDIDPPSGVLLYGPPGTGKTMLARAVASTSSANFTAVNGPELLDRYVGESERAVRRVFGRARSNAPTVLFFDELDALGATRSDDDGSPAANRVVSQLLTELDGVERREGVTVIGATNRPRRIDDALLRPGRFDRILPVEVPDSGARAEIFRIHLRGRTADEFDLDFGALAKQTEGYTGSDIAAVVREAGLLAIEERIGEGIREDAPSSHTEVRIARRHIRRALGSVDPSLSPDARERFESFDHRD